MVEEKYFISKDKALDFAVVRLLESIVTKTVAENWRSATVNTEPLVIYDINGIPLFYEFSVEADQKPIGRIRASASKVLGPAIYTVHLKPRSWDVNKATEHAKLLADREKKGQKIASTQLVCYSYPKIGLMVVLADPKTNEETERFIIDAASYNLITPTYSEKDYLGAAIWSMYERIPKKDIEDRVRRWEEDDKKMNFIKRTAAKHKIDIRAKLSDEALKLLDTLFKKEIAVVPTELVKPVWPISKKIALTLHGQEHCVWCACASGQMVLKHHHYYYKQSEICTAMQTSWNPNTCNGGTSYSGIVTGMESLSHNYLDATKKTPNWIEIKDHINNNRPFISCIPFHARVCSGYSWFILAPWPFSFVLHRNLYIYDPWPVASNNAFCDPHGGDEYWEDFDATSYWDLVYFVPCAGTMVCQ